MNRKPASSLRTFSGFAFALALIAGVMNLAATGVSANEAAKDTTPGDFPDYSNVQGYQLQPGSKILATNATQILRVVNCAPATGGPDDLAPLVNTCEGIYDGEVVSPATVSDWSVNGVVGGNSIVGTIKGNRDTAIYTAPAKKPTPNTVAVSAKMKLTGSLNSTVVSNITITDLSKYTGTVKFSSTAGMAGVHVTDGMAQVTWTLIEDLPDVRTYTASGTISAGLAPALQGFTCTPVPVSGKIDVKDKLVVYTDRSRWNPGTYAFVLNIDDPNTMLTAKCESEDGGVMEFPLAKQILVGVGGNCLPDTTPRPVAFENPAELQGTFDCPASDFFASLSARWSFVAE
jgi:hypothetical protein